MSVRLLVAVSATHEATFVATVSLSRELSVARRCADVPDLLAAAGAGVGTHAIVSPDVPQLERDVIDQLRRLGIATVAVVAPHDEQGERRIRQLGIDTVIGVDADLGQIERAVADTALPMEHAALGVADRAEEPPREVTAGTESLDARLDAALEGDLSALRKPAGGSSAGGEAESRGELIAVWGPIGSPGRTTVALTLAAEYAAGGLRTLLIDADTYGATVAQALGLLDDTPGLATAARASEHGTLDAPGLVQRSPEVSPRLRVLTGLPRADRWPEVRDAAMSNILDVSRLVADVVIVDCGFSVEADEELSYDTLAPRRNATTLTTLSAADHLVVVGAGDPVGVQRLVRALADLGHVSSPPPTVVVNKVRSAATGPRPAAAIRDVLARFSGVETITVIPDDRDACDAAMLAGRTLVEQAPESKLCRAVGALARDLLPDRLGAQPSRRRGIRR